jgi:adenine phosphoribosyltransferase
MINEFAKLHSGQKIDKIVGIDARGFLLAAALAYKLKTGLVKRKTSAKNDIGRICFGIWKQHYRNA